MKTGLLAVALVKTALTALRVVAVAVAAIASRPVLWGQEEPATLAPMAAMAGLLDRTVQPGPTTPIVQVAVAAAETAAMLTAMMTIPHREVRSPARLQPQ